MAYFPIFCAKQEEARAVNDCAGLIAARNVIVPVFEPTDRQAPTLAAALDAGVRMCVVVNPYRGMWANGALPAPYQPVLAHANTVPTLIVRQATTVAQVNAFAAQYPVRAFLVREPSADVGVVPAMSGSAPAFVLIREHAIPHVAGLPRDVHVDIEDEFHRRNNTQYPWDEFFSARQLTIGGDPHYAHFGDFSIVGDHYSSGGGGRAQAIAIHHVYATGPRPADLRIRHYVVPEQAPPLGVPALTVQALAAAAADQPAMYAMSADNNTGGSAMWGVHAAAAHNPGLGMLKRIAIRHHLELMNAIL